MKTNVVVYSLFLLASMLAYSCYPDKPDDFDELDVVQTQYDTTFNFDTKQYYLLPDTIPVITDNNQYVKSTQELSLEDSIINIIARKMNQAGYTRIAESDTSNKTIMNNALVVLPSRFTTVYSSYYYDYYYYGYDSWDWYYGLNSYYPGYYARYHYPWGYPAYYSSYAIGTVVIEMVDPANPISVDSNNRQVSYPVRWIAVLNGVAESSASNARERITKGIEQAFRQSPYLTK